MTSEQQSPALNDSGVDNLFETVIRGYHKRQVEDYVAWLQEQVSAVKAELLDARRELGIAREDLVDTKAQLQTRPQHEEVSLRMAQILRLAEEEAQQERDAAAQQAGGVLEQARAEARASLEAAQQAAAEIVERARRESDDALAGARAEANRLVDTARQQAEATMSDARERAERVLADADRRTEQITALQQNRLSAVLGAHEDVINRLEAVRGVIGEVLVQDRDLGDPASQVDPAPLPLAGLALDPRTLQLPPRQSSSPAPQQPLHRAAQSPAHVAPAHAPAVPAQAPAPWAADSVEGPPPSASYQQHAPGDIGASPQPAPPGAPGPGMIAQAGPTESEPGAGAWGTSPAAPIASGGITPGSIRPGDTSVGFAATPPVPDDLAAPDGRAPGQPVPVPGTGWPFNPVVPAGGSPDGLLATPPPVSAPAGPVRPELPMGAMSAPAAPAEAYQERPAIPPLHEPFGTAPAGTGVSGVAWANHLLPAAGSPAPLQAPELAQPVPMAAGSEVEQPEDAPAKATARRAAPRTPRARKGVEPVSGDDGTHGGDASA
jgi:cell division septum initiation protein DivIVA